MKNKKFNTGGISTQKKKIQNNIFWIYEEKIIGVYFRFDFTLILEDLSI